MYLYIEQKDNLMARLKRVEGQVKGIMRMIEDGRYCPDILQQIAAMSGAMDEVALILLQSHIKGCVTDAIQTQQGEESIEELMSIIRKVVKR
jgi:DNA-binding FrmR family transcriptional regulator